MVVSFTNHQDDKEPDLKLVYISVANKDSVRIGKVCQTLNDVKTKIHITCADSEDVDHDEEAFIDLLKAVRVCDFVFFKFHGDPSFFLKYDRIRKIIDDRDIDTFFDSALDEVNEENRHLFKSSDKDYFLIRTYLDIGGEENYASMLKWACKTLAGNDDVEIANPVLSKLQGLYQKSNNEDMGIEEFIKDFDSNKPTVGIMTHHTSYHKDRMNSTDDLISKLESIDCNVIPVYFNSYPNEIVGSIGVKATIDEYFKLNGKVLVDSVIITSGFSQITLSDPNAANEGREIHNFFEDLNVPLIQAPTISRSVSKWEADDVGMNVTELSTGVIWPEFDGKIISVPLSFNESLGNGEYKNSSVEDRVHRIATLAKEWGVLRRLAPKDRKIAILFHMYPPTNDRLGGAAGLDTFESVCNCLQAMNDEGYALERVPENGKEILDELLAGLTTDLEWVPENEITDRAADMWDP